MRRNSYQKQARATALRLHAGIEAKEEKAFQAANTVDHQAMVNAWIAIIGVRTK